MVVEGDSDRVALETLAARMDVDLDARGASIAPIGGAHAVRRFLGRLAAAHPQARVAGLCDAGQEVYFQRALEDRGLGDGLDRGGLARLGFFVCVLDLEDELIRALGAGVVEAVIEAQGELRSYRSFQRQPAQAAVAAEAQLRRFMGTHAGRKAQYARALVDALDLRQVPAPLAGALTATGTSLRIGSAIRTISPGSPPP
ncbi:MAG TPA: TOPRIM nucleotidyl transferase/hydrolase domain-containing protein [Candidatus Dormibacteraeota bacterium]|nr:TOPRIM nucleotidyl transferase/hydrolase domain-containing protein [Candidatus Dormibacteraeota bacterium]